MYRIPLRLPGMLRIVISYKVAIKMSEQQQHFTYLPNPDRLIYDLRKLGSQGGVPAILYQRQGKTYPELQLYTDRHYYLVLHLAEQRQDGYALGYVEPLGLREQERMSKGVLLLQPADWSSCGELRGLQGYSSYWSMLVQAWNQLEVWRKQARPATMDNDQEGLRADQESYLNKIQTLIDLEHRLEQDQNQLPQQIFYRKVEATGEQRYARDIYTFLLQGSPAINEKNMLRIVEERGLQARVLSYKGKRLTLKFERAVDLDRIPPSGTFEPIVSGAIYRTQQEALETLREGGASNPHLLRVLVNQQFQPYTPGTLMPETSLNPGQREAFQRALTFPDVLCVWGPPGTGKSRTITEIARQYSKQGRRVLITSGTHKAVDNVLEQFLCDERLMVVRFGHEDRILETVRARLTIDERTREMRQHILKRTHALASQLQAFMQHKSVLSHQLTEAQAFLAQWQINLQRLQELQALLEYVKQQVSAPYQPRLHALTTDLQALEHQIQKQLQQFSLWSQKQQRATQKCAQPVLGLFYRWRVNVLQRRLAQLDPLIAQTRYSRGVVSQEHEAVQQELQQVLKTHPEYLQHTRTLGHISAQNEALLAQVLHIARQFASQSQGALSAFPGGTTGTDLQRYFSQIAAEAALLEKRALLLHNWQSELETSAEQLTPEVLRYADIVGATCIGVATAKGLTEIDFDLVIVDEAGQISMPNLLVPLVRARRAILVGDHKQLPPFAASSVQTWIKNLSPQALQDLGMEDDFDNQQLLALFAKSAFEHLLTARLHRDNLVVFTEQRRMPGVIAEFASQHFYQRQLTTVRNTVAEPDSPFRSELVFIDTSTLPVEVRREMKREKTEEWGNPGFTNPCEARLLARLAAMYEQSKANWAIIVPYRAQASLIISFLEKLIEAPDFRWEERIATVDSFQGGERDYVLYSFTRSNSSGGIGFLTELRRFNVALTRARRQMILVGDLSTLTCALDPPFAALMQSLRLYVKEHGELLTYQEGQQRLS